MKLTAKKRDQKKDYKKLAVEIKELKKENAQLKQAKSLQTSTN